MKNQFCLFVIAALINLCSIHAQEQVSMQSLLREMVDRKQLVEYPESIPYKAMQASSYNRASVSPDQPGWFADSDGVFCIRTEKNREGETEWVLMEDKGPGVITKIWAVCFYYGLDDTTGANLKIYLEGKKSQRSIVTFLSLSRVSLLLSLRLRWKPVVPVIPICRSLMQKVVK